MLELLGYEPFHKQLEEFIDNEGINFYLDSDEVERIHTSLEIRAFQALFDEREVAQDTNVDDEPIQEDISESSLHSEPVSEQP